MKKINISTEKYPNTFTLVDDEDFARLSNMGKWHKSKGGYVMRQFWKDGEYKNLTMHKVLMTVSNGKCIDHRDRDKLNNQKSNYRYCTNQQNTFNKKPMGGKSKYKGVYQYRGCKTWAASIRKDKLIYLGNFKTETEAALAYNKAAKELHGEFAYQNEF